MKDLQTIMVTTDFSETAARAFPFAQGLADKYGAELIVLHVDDDRLPPLILEYTDIDLEQIVDRQQERARRQLEREAQEHFGLGPKLKLQLASGTPHAEIVRLAEDLGVDLIVMATHGRGFISHAILGSTTERVLRRAPCPVLVVRDARGN